jgi:hypothetical protein
MNVISRISVMSFMSIMLTPLLCHLPYQSASLLPFPPPSLLPCLRRRILIYLRSTSIHSSRPYQLITWRGRERRRTWLGGGEGREGGREGNKRRETVEGGKERKIKEGGR